jgi:chromosome segregation ATPase
MLEMRADRLETWSGPGQAEAFALSQQQLRADLAGIRRTQDRHSRTLAVLVSDVAVLKTDVAQLKTDVAQLKTDVAELKTDVAQLKTDVAELKTDVAALRSDMAEMKGTVQQILARLPER